MSRVNGQGGVFARKMIGFGAAPMWCVSRRMVQRCRYTSRSDQFRVAEGVHTRIRIQGIRQIQDRQHEPVPRKILMHKSYTQVYAPMKNDRTKSESREAEKNTPLLISPINFLTERRTEKSRKALADRMLRIASYHSLSARHARHDCHTYTYV